MTVEDMQTQLLAIIIVAWNTRDLLHDCLNAVTASLAHGAISARILVVDNASADGTPALLRTEFPAVELLETGQNLGFAAGNNVALRHIGVGTADPATLPPYILLLNPDTAPLGDAIPRLVAYLEGHPELVAVGPQLRYGDGTLQSSRRRFPTPLTLFWESTALERLWPTNPWRQRYHCADQPADQEQPVDWLVGAALLVRSSAIARAGLLDAAFFMYSEELEWQWRLQMADSRLRILVGPQRYAAVHANLASRIAYLPTAVIRHYEGKSSEQAITARHLNFQRSKLHLTHRLYGRGLTTLLRRLLRIGYTWEIAQEQAKLLLRHRPALRMQRISVYRAVLRGL